MKIHGTYILNRLLLLGALFGVLLVIPVVTGVSVVNAKSASDVLQARTDRYAANLSVSDTCKGPTVYLTGTTTVRYRNNSVADGTIFDRTDWYSDAVGNGYNTAFTVGSSDPPPMDVCVLNGVINGHIPLSWTWDEIHSFGGSGDRTHTGRVTLIDGARIHNVQDGWDPRELPEFGNTGIMQMRNTYMTGIRDDSIENDDFMPGFVEDSLFDGVHTFLSEQNQSGGTPVTIGPGEDLYIRITRVYVRLYPVNNGGNDYPGRWFKWQPRGTVNHNLIITDSVFAVGPTPKDDWSELDFPAGTTFVGTNYILWLGTPGLYDADIPPGVVFMEGQAAIDKWNQVRNSWLVSHGYSPRPVDDLNPMDDPVVAPAFVSISGNAGVAGATLNYMNGSTVADGSGNYSFNVPRGWSGTVTPSKTCYDFSPANNSYSNVLANQTAQNFLATPVTYTFCDVPDSSWAWQYIERLYNAGVTSGCSVNPKLYCPAATVTRDQMAIFLLRGKHGSGYTPPQASGVFQDVPVGYWAGDWIEQLAVEGITLGCSVSPKLYCPTTAVTRDQMAIFLLRAKHGSNYVPPPATGVFQDVPVNYWAAAWIEQLAAEGITSGCSVSPKLYCPTATVTRDQMAVFLVRNFNLP